MQKDTFKIIAKVKYLPINGGFWGLVDAAGNAWRSAIMPEDLKKEDLKVELTVIEAAASFSIFMWGKEIDIIDYNIINE